MFRIFYDVKVRSASRELFFPHSVYKVFNYIRCSNIDINTVNIDDICYINNEPQKIIKKTDSGFFVAPGIYYEGSISDIDLSIIIHDNQYLLSTDPYSDTDHLLIGSIVFNNTITTINTTDKIRLINLTDTIANMWYTKSLYIEHVKGTYLHDTATSILYFEHSNDTFDWLRKAKNIYAHSLDTVKKDIDIYLYYRCYGGAPNFVPNTSFAKYKLLLENLSDNTVIEKDIYQFGYETINLKNQYRFKITDALNNSPEIINDLVNSEEYIVLDFTDPFLWINEDQFISQKHTSIPTISDLWR